MNQRVLTGSCLCKRVKYSIETEPQQFYFCHCEQCRKITGSAFASNILAAPAEVKWLSGEDYVKRFDYQGDRLFTKVFCSECGSGLPFLNKSGKKLFIPAGSLDSEPGMSPEHNIFWGDRSSWYEAGISAPKSEGFVE
ncbi:MAG: GFA family protein [Gammaproteobacteria bacterium]